MNTNETFSDAENMELRIYRKQELAMKYFPESNKECAGRNFRRWITHCKELYERLLAMGYDKNRKYFLKREVELIVEFLGEP